MSDDKIISTSHITGKFPTQSELINSVEYFEDYQKDIKEFLVETKNLFRRNPGLAVDDVLLSYDGEPKPFLFDHTKYFNHYIVACKKLNDKLELNKKLATVKNRKLVTWKTVNPKYALHVFKPRGWKKPKTKIINLPEKDVIYQVKIYKPFMANGRIEDIKIQQEVWLKGVSTLKKLRESLVCHLDYCGLEDLSEDPSSWTTVKPTVKSQIAESSAYFFFIGNNFYTGSDISSTMTAMDFLNKKRLGEFYFQSINSKLEDIELSVGRPYVYQHLGHCEHVFVVSDIRLRDYEDPPCAPQPYVNAISNSIGKQCMLCNLSYAHWLVTNFAKLMLSRAFLCNRCFLSYCYVDKRKNGDFEAYQFFDPSVFL